MDCTDHLRAEQVRQVSRHGGEAAAVHRQDHAKRQHEQRQTTQLAEHRHGSIERKAQAEEHEVGALAPDEIRAGCPEKATANVEQAQQTGKACGNRGNLSQLRSVQLVKRQVNADQLAGKHLLQQRRSHANDADTRRHV